MTQDGRGARKLNLDEADWPAVSELLDQYLDLPAEAREKWLDALSPEHNQLKPALARVLQSQGSALATGFLDTLPRLNSRSPAAGEMIGPYRLIRELGHGGMGAVWLAARADGAYQRHVALKLAHPFLAVPERFALERDILCRLVHPHIARLYDAGIAASGQSYLALEYVDGLPITVYCLQREVPLRARLRFFLDVLRAVQHAHSSLVIHRDLKPSNILVSDSGGVRLLDFGIAKFMRPEEGSELTAAGTAPLTPDYASPEQLAGMPVTTASDIYSLGVVLYQLLAGGKPFHRTSRNNAPDSATGHAEPPSHRARTRGELKLARALSGDLDRITLKALEVDPAQRFATADAFAGDIERYLRGEAILARPPSPWYAAGKFIRRNKALVSTAAALALAVTMGLGAALYEAHIAAAKTAAAEGVTKFLLDIFRANSSQHSDPLRARQTTALELLDSGAANLDRELAGAPEAKIEILGAVSELFTDLGVNERAVAYARKRVDLVRTTFGNYAPELAAALVALAFKLGESSSVNDEEAVLREAQAILDRNRDRASLTRAGLYQALGMHYVATDVAKSEEYSARAVEIYRRHPLDEPFVNALNFLGQARNTQRKYREAASAFAEAIQLAQSSVPVMHGPMPALCTYLGEVRFRMMDLSGAEQSYRRGLEEARKFRGEEHEDTLQTKLRLGSFLFDTGRAREGLDLLREAWQLAVRSKGPNDAFHTAQALTAYGSRLIDFGNVKDGFPLLAEANAIRRRARRTATRAYARAEELLAIAESQLHQFDRAARLIDDSLAIRARIGDTRANRLLEPAILAQAQVLLARGDATEASKVLQSIAGTIGGNSRFDLLA